MRILQDLIECLQYNRGLAVLELMGVASKCGVLGGLALPPREQTSLVPNLPYRRRKCNFSPVHCYSNIYLHTFRRRYFQEDSFWEALLTANANNDNGAGTHQ